ncbi:arginine--tRNA ligase [Candidatus Kuenenbacteria bacterium HGW-Kuenenbacteria-1]|uniref:Arginine--tRNA ligase n=1 Tax=Candidatus Kuenenbacteria bacterium HGW-Kuenenbacteria-1 TaxID=2013812 RepID=A0A2N1UMS7_9BACT|nr:MAG: arginine--tRNA ligase [Candidatus Kuenenbacteria bacterium HGW-Kuenenbacteria-1]
MLQHLKDQIKKIVLKKFGIKIKSEKIVIEQPPEAKMGDFCFSCFLLAKEIKKFPKEIAESLAQEIKCDKIIKEIKNTGPYLNFFIHREIFFENIYKKLHEKKKQKISSKQIIIEFSSPNTNKPLHLGHFRSSILGMSLANLLEENNYQVIKANSVNDRGIHICKAMLAYQKWGENKTPTNEKIKGDHFVGNFYVMFDKKAKKEQEKKSLEKITETNLYKEALEMLKKWEQGDVEIMKLWKKMNKWVLYGFKKTYQRIGINFDQWYFENQTYKVGQEIILKALKKGICYQREDKAIEIDLTQYGLDKKVLLRADGTSVYMTQDIGLAKLKFSQFKLDQSIILTGTEQIYHFQVLFKILELLNFKWQKKCIHLVHEMVNLPEGKMKSREGIVVDSDNLLNEMCEMAQIEIKKRDQNISLKELRQRAEKISLAAIKFHLLKVNPKQRIIFNPKQSLSFEGATGPYLQYTYARIQSILKKLMLGGSTSKYKHINFSYLKEEEEWEIGKRIFEFSDVIKKAALDYNPAILAEYLLKLASSFNKFYHQHSVIKAESEKVQKARLALIQCGAIVLKKGLNLLGIEEIEKM